MNAKPETASKLVRAARKLVRACNARRQLVTVVITEPGDEAHGALATLSLLQTPDTMKFILDTQPRPRALTVTAEHLLTSAIVRCDSESTALLLALFVSADVGRQKLTPGALVTAALSIAQAAGLTQPADDSHA